MTLHCYRCDQELQKVVEQENDVTPYGGLIFYAYGNYGSTLFDPQGPERLLIVICDACIKENIGKLFIESTIKARDQIVLEQVDDVKKLP